MQTLSRSARALLVLALLFVSTPFFVRAFPFGGQTQVHHYCYNAAIYALLGPPRGGPYIWTPSTRTYQFGPPRGVGQWLLGLTGPPYYCIVTRSPIFVKEGISIMMMGSSGPAAPSHPALSLGTTPVGSGTSVGSPTGGTGSGTGGTGSGGTGGSGTGSGGSTFIGHVVISEVYPEPVALHGSAPDNEWVEIYNGDDNSIDVSGWTIEDDSTTRRAIPGGYILAPGSFLILTQASTTESFWTVIPPTRVIVFGSSIGDGLSRTGDSLILRNASGVIVDRVSWGTDTSGFNPPFPAINAGHSMARNSFTQDTNTRSEWADDATPGPGVQ